MGERSPAVGWVHVVVHVVLTTRTAIALLLVLIDGRETDPGSTMTAVVALVAMTLYLGKPARWSRAAGSLVMPVLDGLLAVVVLVSFGTDGWALGYVIATVFLWAMTGRWTAWFVAIAGPMTIFLVLLLADVVLGQVTDAVSSAARMLVLGLAVPAAGRTRSLLRSYRSLERTLREERLRAAQAEERTRLSIEMHDSVAKSLHGIHLMSSHLAARLEEEGHPAHEQLGVLRDSIHQARLEVRQLVASRRVVADAEPHLALAELVQTWSAGHPDVAVETRIDPFQLGPGTAHELLSAVSEVLENVARHASAHTLVVEAGTSSGWVTVSVTDDGVGMGSTRTDDWVARGHYGVDGAAKRMARARGRMSLQSSPGAGTRVVLECPAHVAVGDEPAEARGRTGERV